jgi:tetratricopeptide (TPR) repeat protein
VAALLIANGANVNARDVHQKTPLHWAATTGSLRTAKVLVEHGGDIGLRDSDGNTPIQLAEQSMGRNLALALRETGSASLPGTSSQKDFREYLSLIASQRDRDQQSACEEEHYLNSRGDDSIRRVCHLFVSVELRKKIIQSVLTMTSPPAISEEAKRAFVEGNVFFRGAKSTADYNLAVNKYKEALTEAPWWGLAYNNLGIALRDAGRLDEAKTALELYLLTKPADASTAQMTIYEIGGQQQLAEEHKRQERDRQIQCAQECRDGNTARGRGSSGYNDAIQHYKKAAEICSDPRDSAVMYAGLGDVYRLQGNLDEAYKYMQEAFELDPNPQGDRRWIYSNFGVLLDNRGDHAAACQCWRKGCNAGDATSCSNLSRCP